MTITDCLTVVPSICSDDSDSTLTRPFTPAIHCSVSVSGDKESSGYTPQEDDAWKGRQTLSRATINFYFRALRSPFSRLERGKSSASNPSKHRRAFRTPRVFLFASRKKNCGAFLGRWIILRTAFCL
jgi:hypothetical protein